MTLIIIKNKEVAALPYLLRLVLKYIYDKKNMTPAEERLMQDSFIRWYKKVDLKWAERRNLQDLASLIDKDMKGKFAKRKELFAKHKVDYRKFHRLPESYFVGN